MLSVINSMLQFPFEAFYGMCFLLISILLIGQLVQHVQLYSILDISIIRGIHFQSYTKFLDT